MLFLVCAVLGVRWVQNTICVPTAHGWQLDRESFLPHARSAVPLLPWTAVDDLLDPTTVPM